MERFMTTGESLLVSEQATATWNELYKPSDRSELGLLNKPYEPDRDAIPLPTKKSAFRRIYKLERAKGFEPSTSTLARLRSTPELYPHL